MQPDTSEAAPAGAANCISPQYGASLAESPHRQIENGAHAVRSVTFGEAHPQVRAGSIPQALAAVRTTAVTLLRAHGEATIAAACRRLAAHPWQALTLLGIPDPTST